MNLEIIRTLVEKRVGGLRKLASDIDMSEANLHRCINNNKIQAGDLEKISIHLGVDIRVFFDNEILSSSHTTGDFSPAVSGVQGDATVTISNEGEALQKERIAHLQEKVQHLQDIIEEKERLIKVLMETRR